MRRLFAELGRKKSALSATVRGLLYSSLGGLAARFPAWMQKDAAKVAETLCRALQEELESTKEPSTPILVGTMRGLTDFLTTFSSELTKPRRVKVCDMGLVYKCVFKGLHHQEATRYAILTGQHSLHSTAHTTPATTCNSTVGTVSESMTQCVSLPSGVYAVQLL